MAVIGMDLPGQPSEVTRVYTTSKAPLFIPPLLVNIAHHIPYERRECQYKIGELIMYSVV